MTGNTWMSPTGDTIIQATAFNTQSDAIRLDALAGGGAALAWAPVLNGYYESFATVLSSDGAQSLAPFEASSGWDFSNNLQDVTGLSTGSFLVTFETLDGDYYGVATRIFDPDGTSVAALRINTYTSDTQAEGQTAALNGGGSVTVWTSPGQDGSQGGIFGQILDDTGSTIGSEFQVNTTTDGAQTRPTVTALPDGGFAVVWYDQYEFYLQRFDASGGKIGGEVHLTADTTYGSTHPRIDTLRDGNIVLTWSEKESDAHDSGEGVFARIIDANGAPVTPIIKVDPDYDNDSAEGNQAEQAVTALDDGGFLISWEDDNVDGIAGNYGIVARRFDAAGTPVGDQFVVTLGGKQGVGFSGHPAAPVTQTEDGTVIFAWLDETDFQATGGTRELKTRSFETGSVIVGTDARDWMMGTEENDLIRGLENDDWLFGNGGNDLLEAGAGRDEVSGGPGNDTLFGGDGQDTVFVDVDMDAFTLSRVEGGLMMMSADGTDFISDDIEEFFFLDGVMTYAEVDALLPRTGTDGDDVLDGTSGPDTIDGLAGNDLLRGADGDDLLRGGDGVDTLNGGEGNDTLIGGTSDADLRDIIYGLGGEDSIEGGYGNDELIGGTGADTIAGGFGADTVIGNQGDDVLTGSAFGDMLFGNDGFDFINGGFGSDRVNGGADGDRFFHIGIAGHGSDWIQDYNAAEGDLLFYGGGAGAATADDFIVQIANTAGAGDAGVNEAFITHIPTGNLLWALVDGDAQASINIQIGGQVFDLVS